jgi:hypothetical protein
MVYDNNNVDGEECTKVISVVFWNAKSTKEVDHDLQVLQF